MSSLAPLQSALDEINHVFGGVAYSSQRRVDEPRESVAYDEEVAGSREASAPPEPSPPAAVPPQQRPAVQRNRKRVERTQTSWVDLDAAAVADELVQPVVRKKARKPVARPVCEPAEYESLLEEHLGSRQSRDRGNGTTAAPPNLTPSGEPIDAASIKVARLVAERLNEALDDARRTIERTVALLGTEKVIELLERAEETEASGGLLTCDGSQRRRTRGGVFFYLVKQLTNRKEKEYIWGALAHPPAGSQPRRGEARGHRPRRHSTPDLGTVARQAAPSL